MHKTRARDTDLRKAIRYFTAKLIAESGDPHKAIWISDMAGLLFITGFAASEQEAIQWTKLILDHLVLEGEYRYADPYKDTYSKLTLEEEGRVYSAMAENAKENPGVKEYLAALAERAKRNPSTDK